MNNESEFNDWDSVEAAPEYSLVPKGDYKMLLEKINQETVKDDKHGNFGKPRYNCQFTITDDRQTGRKIFRDFMPHSDKSRSAVKSLALATNTALKGNMLDVLIAVMDKDFIANVGISKGTGDYPDQNTIWVFKLLLATQYQQTYYKQACAPAPPMQPQQPIRPQGVPLDAITQDNGLSWWVWRNNSPQRVW